MIYYIADLNSLEDGLSTPVLVSEKDLASFIANYDSENYRLINVYGVGSLSLDYREFIKKESNLEHG